MDKLVVIFIIIGIGVGIVGVVYAYETKNEIQNSLNPEPTAVSVVDDRVADLKQKLQTKCVKLQKWYDDVDLHQDFKCVEYADAWSSLIK